MLAGLPHTLTALRIPPHFTHSWILFSHRIVIFDKAAVVITMTLRLFQMILSQLWRSAAAHSQPKLRCWWLCLRFDLAAHQTGTLARKSPWQAQRLPQTLAVWQQLVVAADRRVRGQSAVSPSLSKCLFHSRVTRHAAVCPTPLRSLPRRHHLQVTCV